MDRDRLLSGLLVRGELSNYKTYPSGHHYFTLKDSGRGPCGASCSGGTPPPCASSPENGMQVIAAGRITVFPRDGQYQLYCVRLTPEGAGDLHVAFEQLKEKLLREGLFDPAHKKPMPALSRAHRPDHLPGRGGGAGHAPHPGGPLAHGPGAASCRCGCRGRGRRRRSPPPCDWANLHQAADLIITGRGGGSMEDLWAFNEEMRGPGHLRL